MRETLSKMGTCAQRALLALVLAVGLVPLPAFSSAAHAAETSTSTGATTTLSDSDYAAIAQSEASGACISGEALVVYHASGAAKGATGALGIQSESDPLEQAGFGAANTWDLSGADSSAAAAADGALSVQSEQTGSALASGSDVRVALVKRDDMSTADLVASLDALSFVECAQPNYVTTEEALSTEAGENATAAATAASAASSTSSSSTSSSASSASSESSSSSSSASGTSPASSATSSSSVTTQSASSYTTSSSSASTSSSSSTSASRKLLTQALTPGATITNDTLNSLQWGLSGTTTEIAGSKQGMGYKTALDADTTSTTTKDSVVVAVMDTGVDYTNPDLADIMWTDPGTIGLGTAGSHGYNGVTGAYDCMPSANAEHGTHCAGIVAAQTNNSAGVASVSGANGHTQLMGLRHETDSGTILSSAYIGCYEYLVRARAAGVNVVAVNCSWGADTASTYVPVLDYAINQAGKAGVLSCFAAGNDDTDVAHDYQAACLESPYFINVASSTPNNALSLFSCYNATNVDVAAPGTKILATVPNTVGNTDFLPVLSEKAGKTERADGMLYYTDIASLGTDKITCTLYDASTKTNFTCPGAVTLSVPSDKLLESDALKVTMDCTAIKNSGHNPADVRANLSWSMDNPFKGITLADTDPTHYAVGLAVSLSDETGTNVPTQYEGWQRIIGYEGLLGGTDGKTNLVKADSAAMAVADANWLDSGTLTALDTTSATLTAQVGVNFSYRKYDKTESTVQPEGTWSCLITGYGIGRITNPTEDTSSTTIKSAYVPYRFDSGTSMSTPMITGAVAELAALNPNESALQLRGRICGGTTSITTDTHDRYGTTKHTASDGRFTFEQAVDSSKVNANTWSITTSGNQVTVHGYNLSGAKLYVDNTAHTTVTATGTQADSITFTADASLLDGKTHRFDVVDGTTGRYYNASYVTPDSSKDTLTRIGDLPSSENASTGKLVSTVDRLFYADGQGTFLYSCANPSDATASWSKLTAPGAAFTGAKSSNSKDIEYVCADDHIYAFTSGESTSSTSTKAMASVKCNIYSITEGTWSGWNEIGTVESKYMQAISPVACNGTIGCYVRGVTLDGKTPGTFFAAKYGAASFEALTDQVSPVFFDLNSIGAKLYGLYPGTSQTVPGAYAIALAWANGATGAFLDANYITGYSSVDTMYRLYSDMIARQVGVGNGLVLTGVSDTGLGDMQLIGTDCSVTKLGDFGLSSADGLVVGDMVMYGGKLYLNCADHTIADNAISGLYTLPSTAAAKVATTDVTATAKAETGGTATVADWRGSAAGTLIMHGSDTATWTATPGAGYAFKGWYDASGNLVSGSSTYTASTPASITLTAQFTAGTSTAYTVRHFKQQPDGTYASTPDEIDSLTGATGAQTSAVAKSYTGFTAQAFSQEAIAGDGTTAVDIKYKRNAYAVAFDDNGGSGTMASMAATYGVAKKLPACTFARDGYTFAGWNTKADGSGTALADGASVENLSAKDGATVTLYAQWTQGSTPTPTPAPTPVTPSADEAASDGSGTSSTASTGDATLPWVVGLGALAVAAAAGIALAARRRRDR